MYKVNIQNISFEISNQLFFYRTIVFIEFQVTSLSNAVSPAVSIIKSQWRKQCPNVALIAGMHEAMNLIKAVFIRFYKKPVFFSPFIRSAHKAAI